MFDYIQGNQPDIKIELQDIGKQVRQLRELMNNYSGKLPIKRKEFFIDRFISLLSDKKYT